MKVLFLEQRLSISPNPPDVVRTEDVFWVSCPVQVVVTVAAGLQMQMEERKAIRKGEAVMCGVRVGLQGIVREKPVHHHYDDERRPAEGCS